MSVTFKRGYWRCHCGIKYKTREEAEAAENGTQEESIEEEGPETKAGWGIGFQQTEKNTKSPQKKSYSSGEGWSKNKDD